MEKELGLIIKDGAVKVSSRDVARIYSKEHREVLRKIDGFIETIPELGKCNFTRISYIDDFNREQREYMMDRQGFSILANKFTGEKALRFTVEYTNAFEQMAKELLDNPAQQYLEMSEEDRAIAFFQQRKQQRILEEQNKILAPKAQEFDHFMNSNGNLGFNETCKSLGIGLIKFYEFCREKEILMKNTSKSIYESSHLPYQKYVKAGYFEVITITKWDGNCSYPATETLVTPKGVAWLAKILRESNRKLSKGVC